MLNKEIMTILILHGIEGHAGIHWQQWLHDELRIQGYFVIMPNLPNSNHPDRKELLKFVRKIVSHIPKNEEIIIIGHSLGVTTALDYIEITKRKIKGLFSISRFSKDYGIELNSYFLKEKNINFIRVKKNLEKAVVIYADNDPYVPQNILKSLANNLNVDPLIISKGGHLNSEAGYTSFPLLLEEILRI